jgi:hypothetical protein
MINFSKSKNIFSKFWRNLLNRKSVLEQLISFDFRETDIIVDFWEWNSLSIFWNDFILDLDVYIFSWIIRVITTILLLIIITLIDFYTKMNHRSSYFNRLREIWISKLKIVKITKMIKVTIIEDILIRINWIFIPANYSERTSNLSMTFRE